MEGKGGGDKVRRPASRGFGKGRLLSYAGGRALALALGAWDEWPG